MQAPEQCDQAVRARQRAGALVADVAALAGDAGAASARAAARRCAAVAAVLIGIDADVAAAHELARTRDVAGALVADEPGRAHGSGAAAAGAAAERGAAVVAILVGIDAGRPAAHEAGLAGQGAGPVVADVAALAAQPGVALALAAAARRGPAVAAIGAGVDADSGAVHERARARQRALARIADVARRAGVAGRALPEAAARGGSAVIAVDLRVRADPGAVHQVVGARQRAAAAVADVTRRASLAGVAAIDSATRRRAAEFTIPLGDDAGAVALDEPILARGHADPEAAHVARTAFGAVAAHAVLAATGGRAAVLDVLGRIDALTAAFDAPARARQRTLSAVADVTGGAARRGVGVRLALHIDPAVGAVAQWVDALAVALDEAVLTRRSAGSVATDVAVAAAIAVAAQVVLTAAEGCSAELAIFEPIDAAPGAHESDPSDRRAHTRLGAALAAPARGARAAPAAVPARAAEREVSRGVYAGVAALDEALSARDSAGACAADAALLADLAGVFVARRAAGGRAAVVAVLRRIDAQPVALHELDLARQRAHTRATQVARTARHAAAATVPAVTERIHATTGAAPRRTLHEALGAAGAALPVRSTPPRRRKRNRSHRSGARRDRYRHTRRHTP